MDTKSINVAVAEKIASLGSPKVVDMVVEKLVNAEVAKRAEALAAAVKLAEDTLREVKKAEKPDQVAIGANGDKIETYSVKAYEAKKKLAEKMAKIDKVVNSATDGGNWGELYNLVKGGGNPPAEEKKADDGAAAS